jgi:hypothetical protein
MTNFKSALVRSFRTFLQVLAGALVALPTVDAVTDINALKDPILLALWVAGWAAVVSLVQNLAETMGGTEKLPRG